MNSGGQGSLGGAVEHVLDYLKRMHSDNPNFYYAVQGGHNHSSVNIFWASGDARVSYSYFGDMVIFDTVFHNEEYRVPFTTFSGLNHHGQPVLFGCALMLNESEDAYVWLFQTWLLGMSGRAPVSITTEPHGFVQLAVARVLPNTRHRYSKWSMFEKTRTRLAHVYHSHPTFEVEFRKCVNECDTIEEFECKWQSLLEQYYLIGDKWLQSLYEARHHWVPIYLRGTFFGELMSCSDCNDNRNKYFDGFISADTTIQMLIKQYEKAISSWHEKELLADDNTNNTMPILKTPSPMEKQVAHLYTRQVFMKFQEELVETLANQATKLDESGTITTFRVAKFGENHKAHAVSFNSLETKASCSCQLFEFSGIICRHILSVFRAKNVLTLPAEYILRRWTRNARNNTTSNECGVKSSMNSQESLTVRYNNLRQEAIKFVEEGSKSSHVYNVAMDALREAANKVNAVKIRAAGVMPGGTLADGDTQVHASTLHQVPTAQSIEEKAMKIRELTAELENTNKRCEVYRTNLLAVLKDMEEQKLKLSVKVQNARLSLKE